MRHTLPTLLARRVHGQYYTNAVVGKLLVDSLRQSKIRTALELGAGEGALITAAHRRWPKAHFFSVDIDPRNAPSRAMEARSHFVVDALRHDLTKRIGLCEASADIALCNPPFALPQWKPRYRSILARAGLPIAGANTFGADAFFIAQNLWLLKEHGELGAIVPAGLIVGSRSQAIREALLEQHEIHQIVELPAGTFRGTEVRTFLICLQKGSRSGSAIVLRRLNSDGTESPRISVDPERAAKRMDYSHYEVLPKMLPRLQPHLEILVYRGNTEMAAARHLGVSILHTTDLKRSSVHWNADRSASLPAATVRARRGDLLLARVGRRFFAKISMLKSDDVPISDCVFAIRSSVYRPSELFHAFTSDAGQRWLETRARGACARYITKDDLQTFPVAEFIQ